MPNLRLTVAAILAITAPVSAQEFATRGVEPTDALVAVLPAVMYNAQANLQEPSDTARAMVANQVLRDRLGELLGDQLIPFDRVATVLSSSDVVAIAAGNSCGAIVKCATAAGKAVGARWVVMAKVSKTSNLIWLLTAQLIRAETGEILLDDSTELKGEPDAMVRVGTRIFAERVARTVRSGGVVNNYPNGVPR